MKRIAELDAVRAVAVLLVLIHHTMFAINNGRAWVGVLSIGVDLFFVLSGYLITEIVLKHQRQPWFLRNFYVRRSLRIWPIYYLTLVLVVLAHHLQGDDLGLARVSRFLSFTQTVPFSQRVAESTPSLQHTWSLAVEEQFYLFLPLLTVALSRRLLGVVLAAIVVLATAVRGLQWSGAWTIIGRGDGLALGALLALCLHRRKWSGAPQRWFAVMLMATGLLAVAAPAWTRTLYHFLPVPVSSATRFSLDLLAFSIAATSAVGLVVCFAGHPWLGVLRVRWVCHVGVISYGLYLYHPYVFHWVEAHAGYWSYSLASASAEWMASYALAEASWRLIERPLLSLKDQFTYKGDHAIMTAPYREHHTEREAGFWTQVWSPRRRMSR